MNFMIHSNNHQKYYFELIIFHINLIKVIFSLHFYSLIFHKKSLLKDGIKKLEVQNLFNYQIF